MRISVVIPDRGDRSEFMANCLRMMKNQTVAPDDIIVVDFAPTDAEKDITKRYKKGYQQAAESGSELIFFVENDDWYSPNYLETMLGYWKFYGKPDIFGTSYTIYYHIGLKKWFKMNHISRSSAMSTLIKAGLDLKWPKDNDPYTDIHLWHQLERKVTFTPPEHICLGIKHGVGLCGGANHSTFMERYINDDSDLILLRNTMDEPSLKFYLNA